LEDADRVRFGMTRAEVIDTLGRPPDREWDRPADEREERVMLPDHSLLPPAGGTVHYLMWEVEGEHLAVRLYDGRTLNVIVTSDRPPTLWRRLVRWVRAI
jgi:hypothetical protein